MIVTVVTNPELGWDCIVGVYEGDEVCVEEMFREDAISNDEDFDDMLIFHETELQ